MPKSSALAPLPNNLKDLSRIIQTAEGFHPVVAALKNGRSATIPLAVPSVPNKPGQVITAHVTVVGNGNQKFVIPVTLTIGENLNFAAAAPVAPVRGSDAVLA